MKKKRGLIQSTQNAFFGDILQKRYLRTGWQASKYAASGILKEQPIYTILPLKFTQYIPPMILDYVVSPLKYKQYIPPIKFNETILPLKYKEV